ncbi:ATP-binding protein [Pelobacter seleniigenes]|uniref:ATP-binding protein n=1 Tax=Pelobacter seleniigenes TaxID=407188 RepID=UPI00068E6760|nr:ATP-binding protein [Pelobacter seleniigenes]
MVGPKDPKTNSENLRRLAEQRVNENKGRTSAGEGEFQQRLLHELQVHQIELELQNHDLRQAREELEVLLEQYTDLYDFAPAGHFTIAPNGKILKCNLSGASLIGLDRSRLECRLFHDFVEETTRVTFADFMDKAFSKETKIECEITLKRKDNEPLWVQIQAVVNSSKKEIRMALLDISKLKQAEEERSNLQNQLQQTQKIESIGLLAGGIAHDFNNMLGVILGNTELALRKADPDSLLIPKLEQIQSAAHRSADLIRQLLTFARKQVIAPKVLNLNEQIADMLNILQRLIGENIHLSWLPTAELWQVEIDPSQLDQILANLCINARDAIAEIGKISIATGNQTFDESHVVSHPNILPGEYVRLTISDDGRGMDKKVQERIFEPFFTTKEFGEGSGLGLATVYGAIKQNKGFVTVYSRPGQGAIFNIYLPRVKAVVMTTPQLRKEPIRHGTETILLVEDNEMLLEMLKSMLQINSYSVLAATTPDSGLALSQHYDGPIHLLISDVIMPQMNGKKLAEKIRTFRPDIKVIFMSGYTGDIIAKQGLIPEGVHFLQKPVTIEMLLSMVREVLDVTP